MTKRWVTALMGMSVLAAVFGCSAKKADDASEAPTVSVPVEESAPTNEPVPVAEPVPVEGAEPNDPGTRSSLSRAACEAQGARVVGDIGDGAVHRPDYVCDNGQPPIGSIMPAPGEPVATEGAVCCPVG